ncbi:MAG: AhpC/TSA family protein [Bacteroidetes bacterium]|nr:AhpC/TSA family protein [Bacteroidota bacterium]
MLLKNDKAIDFIVSDYLNNQVTLSDYKGKKVLLSFFRGAACPFCNMRVRELINNYPKFEEKGIVIIAFFASSKEEISEYAGKQNAPFSIIPDPTLKFYIKYGVEQSKWGMLKTMLNPIKMVNMMTSGFFNLKSSKDKPIVPADFLIDEHQSVHAVYYGKDFGDHMNIEKILKWK